MSACHVRGAVGECCTPRTPTAGRRSWPRARCRSASWLPPFPSTGPPTFSRTLAENGPVFGGPHNLLAAAISLHWSSHVFRNSHRKWTSFRGAAHGTKELPSDLVYAPLGVVWVASHQALGGTASSPVDLVDVASGTIVQTSPAIVNGSVDAATASWVAWMGSVGPHNGRCRRTDFSCAATPPSTLTSLRRHRNER